MNKKPIILTFLDAYLPGYKSGGPLRTLVNMVEHLSDEFEFWIVTRDRDMGDSEPYPDIEPNVWNEVGRAKVNYLSPGSCDVKSMAKLIASTNHDLMYMNSFFSPFGTIKPLLARKLRLLPSRPVVLAPRGEFSAGALKMKSPKKILYIKSASLLNLYSGVSWQASSEYEVEDIKRTIKVKPENIHIATNLPAPINTDNHDLLQLQKINEDSSLRLVFLSRISPMKNLDFALRSLLHVSARVEFDIYGPDEDQAYWLKCQALMRQLPRNITVDFRGSVTPDHVRSIFSEYDLFFFPTRGENYGHVIAEALSVGTPVLLSDQTPWRNLTADQLGWDIPLDDEVKFAVVIDEFAKKESSAKLNQRNHIKTVMVKRLTDPEMLEANRMLFRNALEQTH